MKIISKIKSMFMQNKKKEQPQEGLSRERIAQHESAHGIIWYLFRNNWTVNQLTIQRENLPDEDINGALDISPDFDVNNEQSIERANELFAIAYAGMIGQNMNLILQRETLLIELMQSSLFNQILDTRGCSDDIKIAKEYLPYLSNEFQVNESSFTKYKIMDLVSMFQEHLIVQEVHSRLSSLLLEKGTLSKEELINFFEMENFQEYVEDENLDINFFNRK